MPSCKKNIIAALEREAVVFGIMPFVLAKDNSVVVVGTYEDNPGFSQELRLRQHLVASRKMRRRLCQMAGR